MSLSFVDYAQPLYDLEEILTAAQYGGETSASASAVKRKPRGPKKKAPVQEEEELEAYDASEESSLGRLIDKISGLPSDRRFEEFVHVLKEFTTCHGRMPSKASKDRGEKKLAIW
eukprot:CAMPEP_0184672068 /NCGR_PEP_ID=MMETSP0308-20130426/85879_1 /TAXON_ID=38269 /ORGANISM="Gloeochaete witrockiana, Strain SAG 46.84" /LENGTH=114 /DNA_ID=CAMNT_0027119323 /DNA_START=122 /DNA_END=463 /DNA_ORIENTATION=-